LRAVGLEPELLDVALPFHFAIKAANTETASQED
jgi:hypothetical protein